jgi:hypothetical protein
MSLEPTSSVPPQRRARIRRRPLTWSALLAVMTAVAVSALPGTASATTVTPKVTPVLDCYSQNSDGSTTVILGYSSTYTTTQTIPHGARNSTTPASYGSLMPTTFQPGTHHGVVNVRVAAADLSTSSSWNLDGKTLNYLSAAYASGICSPSQLPAFANGAAVVVGLVFAGAIGVLVVRRVRRSALRSDAPAHAGPVAAGTDHA